jgi:hypothetical protein
MITIYKNFLNKDDCEYLNNLALNYLETNVVQSNSIAGRYTTRYIKKINQDFDFTERVYELSKKIKQKANLLNFRNEDERGKNGVNVAVTLDNGLIEEHTDPRGVNGDITYRCNVITQKSETGGNLILGKNTINLDVGDVHCYAVSEIPHTVMASFGKTPRILWMFGVQIPKEHWSYEDDLPKQYA